MTAPIEEESDTAPALTVLRRGVAGSPELKAGIVVTLAMALFVAVGRLTIPVLIQVVLDRSIGADDEFDASLVIAACIGGAAVVAAVAVGGWFTYNRLVRTAEATLMGLRVRAFEHIHRLSVADHNDTRRGVLTARVTSDVETLAQFAQWGAVSWIVNSGVIIGAIVVMLVYSWQLTLATIIVYLPLLPVLRAIQRRQLVAYERVRNRVSDTLGATSEAVMGAGVIRGYGYREPVRDKLETAVDRQYRSQLSAHKWFAVLMPITDLFGAAALSVVLVLGVWFGDGWGLQSGELIAFLFLVNLVLVPIAEIGEVLDQTQTALAGWWKILRILDQPIDVVEADPGLELAAGSQAVEARGLSFAYRTGGPVLSDVDLTIAAGANVAVVGETGSGKTTFAKLLCRLADPTEGTVLVGGLDLRDISPEARHRTIRMVPQDGFLFDTTIRENVRYGRDGATDADVEAAFEALGLGWWVARLPGGLDSVVGERGESLSVGERQLVALARAQLADPGLLILDEATSAVDPETEQALTDALVRLSRGRTTLSVAHRLSTAERADRVLVFDAGRIVEDGTHAQLVAHDGVYARLHRSWIGNTRQTDLVSAPESEHS